MKYLKYCIFVFLIGLVCFSFQTQTVKPQFFVIGRIDWYADRNQYETKFEVTVDKDRVQFQDRYTMLSWMNEKGYRAVSISFNTHRNCGYEVYIFE